MKSISYFYVKTSFLRIHSITLPSTGFDICAASKFFRQNLHPEDHLMGRIWGHNLSIEFVRTFPSENSCEYPETWQNTEKFLLLTRKIGCSVENKIQPNFCRRLCRSRLGISNFICDYQCTLVRYVMKLWKILQLCWIQVQSVRRT